MNTTKYNFLSFFYFNIIFFISSICLCFIIDPFCIFHKPIFKNHKFFANEVFMDLGQIETFLAKTNNYDSILIGTSHTENYFANDITQALDSVGTLKLCLSGGYPIELETIMQKAIDTGKVKNVVYGFEIYGFSEPQNTPHNQRVFPYNIYKNKYLSLFNIQTIKISIKLLLEHIYPRLRLHFSWTSYKNLNTLYYYWHENSIKKMHEDFICDENLLKLKENLPNNEDYFINCNYKDVSAINTHLLPILKNNPNINFHIQIIPYSWGWFSNFEKINKAFCLQKYLVKQCQHLSNVKIYGFHNCAFVNNLANYYNESHYQPDINRYMLYAIKHDLHRLTEENINKYEQQMLKNLKSFKIKENYAHMDSLEELIQQNSSKAKL